MAVHQIGVLVAGLVYLMVFPHRIDEECLHDILLLHAARIDGVHQVGVVEHHFRRLLGERLAVGINNVDQACVGQIFDIVHHGGTAGVNVIRQFADVGSLGAVNGEVVEQPLDASEVFQLNLLDEQDVHLRHHVHRLQKIFGIVAALLEEWVEAMMHIVLEKLLRTGLGQYLFDNVLVVGEYLLKRVCPEIVASHQVEKLAEGETTQVVTLHDAVQLWILLLQTHHARTCEDDFQVGVAVVASAQPLAPVLLLENLVNQKYSAPLTVELAGKLLNTFLLKIEVVHIHIEALLVASVEIVLRILKQECGLAHTAGALDADETVVPIDLIHQATPDRSMGMLYQIGMCAEKGLHSDDLFSMRRVFTLSHCY